MKDSKSYLAPNIADDIRRQTRRRFLTGTASSLAAIGMLSFPDIASAVITGDSKTHVFKECFGFRLRLLVEWDVLQELVPEGIWLKGLARKKYDIKNRRWEAPRWVHQPGQNYINLHFVDVKRVEPSPARFTEVWAWVPIYLDVGNGRLPSGSWVPICWSTDQTLPSDASSVPWQKVRAGVEVFREADEVSASLKTPSGDLILSASATVDPNEITNYRNFNRWFLTSSERGGLGGTASGQPMFIQEGFYLYSEKRPSLPGSETLQITGADPFLSKLGVTSLGASDVYQWQISTFDISIHPPEVIDPSTLVAPL